MIKIITIAFRNILRNKRRTALTFFAIVAGITALIIFGGFVEFSMWGLRERIIKSELGHIQVYKKGYTSSEGQANPYDYLIEDVEKLKKRIESMPHVEVITERVSFSGLISTGKRTVTTQGMGVALENQSKFGSSSGVVRGTGLKKKRHILVGDLLLKTLGAEIGEYVSLLTTTVDGSMNAIDLKIKGIISTGSRDYDSVVSSMPLSTTQLLLNTQKVEKLLILLDKTDHTQQVAESLRTMFEKENMNYELRSWKDLSTFYQSVKRLYSGIFRVMGFIIFAIVFFGIANTMTMAIFERTREIGTIRAIGTQRSTTVFLFLTEGLLIGAIGGLLGVGTGSCIAYVANSFGGFYVPPPPMMTEGYKAQIMLSWETIIYSFLFTVIVSVVSSFYPAYRAANLDIVEALRNE
jgi:putative ABC transport system permease protein